MKSLFAPSPGPRRAGRRRPRRLGAGLAALAAVGALAGCQVDNTPAGYEAPEGAVRRNFVETCTGRIPNVTSTTTLATEQQCGCAFDVFKQRVPYNGEDRSRVSGYPEAKPTFQDLEASLRDDPGKYDELPEDVRKAVQECTRAGVAGPVAPTATAPTGTTAPAGTTTGTTAS